MKSACILTDSSAQLPRLNFVGRELVNVLPFDIYLNGQILPGKVEVRSNQLPRVATALQSPHLIPPEPERILQTFLSLSKQYDTIFAIFSSKELSSLFENASAAAEKLKGKPQIFLIDSKTTSVGLGLLIQKLVEYILAQETPEKIEREMRSLISHTYTLICTPSLSYLQYNNHIEETQSIISEMLGIIPIFTLEDGILSPIEKVKNVRHALTYFQEFVEEFDRIEHVAYIQSSKPNFKDAKLFHDIILASFPSISFSKHLINFPLSILFGPRSSCLIVLESK